jgi:TatD DNase family protein
LVLHIVQAHEEAIAILKEVGPFPNGGLVHSFSAHFSIAKRYIDMGFLISVGAEVTRLQSPVREAVVEIPMHALAIETDAPDQPPFSHGVRISQLNEPAFLVKIAQSVGLLRGTTPEQVLEDSSRNIRRVFLF